jgi:hypothetical protein
MIAHLGSSDCGGKQDMMSGMVSHRVFTSTFTVTSGQSSRPAIESWVLGSPVSMTIQQEELPCDWPLACCSFP